MVPSGRGPLQEPPLFFRSDPINDWSTSTTRIERETEVTYAASTSLPWLDRTTIFGLRQTAETKAPQLFDTHLRLTFPKLASLMQAYRQNKPVYSLMSGLTVEGPFDRQRPSTGFRRSTPKIVNGELLVHSVCRISATDLSALYHVFMSANQGAWLRPCSHLGTRDCYKLDLRDGQPSLEDFIAYFRDHGDFALDGPADSEVPLRVYSCEYCFTDYSIRGWKRPASPKRKTCLEDAELEWGFDINVWHNFGNGEDLVESKWVRIAVDPPFFKMAVPRPGFVVGGVKEAYGRIYERCDLWTPGSQ